MTSTTPKLTQYARNLLARHELALAQKPVATQRKGGPCVCGSWGTDKVGNEWTCSTCWKRHKAAAHNRGVQRCPH